MEKSRVKKPTKEELKQFLDVIDCYMPSASVRTRAYHQVIAWIEQVANDPNR